MAGEKGTDPAAPPGADGGEVAAPPPIAAFCTGCGAPQQGRFCSACGQDALPPETAWRSWVDQCRRLLRTLHALGLRPGRLAQEHLFGARARYIPPFTLFLNAVAVFFLFSVTTGFNLKQLAQQGPPAAGIAAAIEKRAAAEGVATAVFMERAERRFQGVYTVALVLISLVGYTGLFRLVYWKALPGLRGPFTLALNYLAFIFIFFLPWMALAPPLARQLGGTAGPIVVLSGGLVTAAVWNAFAARRLGGHRWPMAVTKALAIVASGTVIDNLMFLAAVSLTLRIA